REARSGGSPLSKLRGEPASGVLGACSGPQLGPVPVVASRRRGDPDQATGAGGDPASVRLPAPACAVATGGDPDEPQETTSALPGGAVAGAPPRGPQASAGYKGADDDAAGAEPALVAGFSER